MGKLLYNGIMKRWLYGAEINEKSGLVFKEGYDDPTYMTFRIEFGDWGASVLDRSIIQTGTTVFRPTYNDYDALPIGLLNCPAPGDLDNAYWQNESSDDYTNFNNIRMYSAFQYLRSRNEDTRAKYLYYFVNGLFEIQKNYPFIFKKVSGLQELEKFDPKSGQRLKTPAKITVECYESLNLKIRTLMEFYRKAAWDDVYQRWILPENMREFKMIIYVFERRTFQETVKFPNGNDKEKYKNAFQEYSKLNADIPVKAYECCPCEFIIGDSVSWQNDYSGNTENSEETSKIVINVKNVKTFFKNGLLLDTLSKSYDYNGKPINQTNNLTQKIDSIMIYDLVDSIERTTTINPIDAEAPGGVLPDRISNMTINGTRSLFLNKDILLEKEDANYDIKRYIWGYSLSGGVSSIHENVLNHMSKTDQQLLFIYDNFQYRGGWIYSLTSGPLYDENKSFWENLGDNVVNVLTGARRQILMSGNANILMYNNCLIDTYFIPPESYNPIINYNNGLGSNKITSINISSREVGEQNFKELEPERELQEQQFKELTSREVEEQEFRNLEEPRELTPQQFSELSSRETPEQEYSELESERQLPDQRFSELSSREVSSQQFNELTGRQVPGQEYKEIKEPRELPEQEYKDLNARELVEQQYKNLKEPREIPEQDYRELNPERVPDTELMNLLLVARSLPGFKDMPLEEVRKLPKQDLLDLFNATERSLPSLKADRAVILKEISKVENTNTKLLELDKDNRTAEEKALEMLKQNQALSSFKLYGGEKDEDEKIKKLKNITLFTKEFTENSDKVKSAYVKSILEMKGQLKNVTKEIVNKLPIQDTYIVKKGEKDNNNINSVLASKNDIDQINHNMKYLAINDNDVPKLSFQTLIQLHEELGDALQRSQAVEGLTAITKNSVATNPDQKTREKAKHSVIKDAPKKKIEVIY